jgi:hypothetical protein
VVAVEGGQRLHREIHVRHLPARVHPGIRTPGDGQRRRLGQPQDPAERLLDLPLDRTQPRLPGPPGEIRPVVAEIKAEPYHDHPPQTT